MSSSFVFLGAFGVPSSVMQTLLENSLLERLCFAALELAVLSVLLALVVRWARFSSQRLVAWLWLIVLAKPLVTLMFGAPIVLFRLDVPTLATSQSTPAVSARSSGGEPSGDDVAQARASLASSAALEAPESERESPAFPPLPNRRADAQPLSVGTFLLAAWGVGIVFFAARYALLRWRLSHRVRGAAPAPESLRRSYATIAREIGLTRAPDVRVIDELGSPALVGFVRSTIVLPRRLVEHGSPASVAWALRHELAHWRRLDPLAIFVRDVVSICFFFHPLLPWVRRSHAEAMEMACDWESLRDPSEAADYAEGLSGILHLMRDRRAEPAVENSLAMATHGRMVRRIRALLDGERARPLTAWSGVSVALVALLVFSFGCSVGRGGAPAEPSKVAENGRDSASLSPAQAAVREGLCWLARHQNSDGSWSPTTIATVCPCEDPMYQPKEEYTTRFDEGLTGLALLSFLRTGFADPALEELVDTTSGKRFRVSEVVERGVSWLTKRQKPDGAFTFTRPFMYSEALAGAAVAEAYARTQNSAWKDAAQRSMDFIQGAQRPSPKGQGLWGWRYASRQEIERFARGGVMDDRMKRELYDADSSITAWCMMALDAGARAGLAIGDEHLAGGLAFTQWVTERNGMVGYLDPKGAGAKVTGPGDHYIYHPAAMSALGMYTRSFGQGDVDKVFLDLAAQQITKDLPAITADNLSIDYYYWFFGSLALNQLDGPDGSTKTGRYFAPWKQSVVTALLALQDRSRTACSNGGWMVPDRWARDGGPIYTTAMNVLTLEVFEHGGSAAAGK